MRRPKVTMEEMLKVMETFHHGGEVEYKSVNTKQWIPCPTPVWNWCDLTYRVKPEPRTFYIRVDHNGILSPSVSLTIPTRPNGTNVDIEVIKVKEVLE